MPLAFSALGAVGAPLIASSFEEQLHLHRLRLLDLGAPLIVHLFFSRSAMRELFARSPYSPERRRLPPAVTSSSSSVRSMPSKRVAIFCGRESRCAQLSERKIDRRHFLSFYCSVRSIGCSSRICTPNLSYRTDPPLVVGKRDVVHELVGQRLVVHRRPVADEKDGSSSQGPGPAAAPSRAACRPA